MNKYRITNPYNNIVWDCKSRTTESPEKDDKGIPEYTDVKFANKEVGQEVFNFLADKTEVEWSKLLSENKTTGIQSIDVYTSHDKSSEARGPFMTRLKDFSDNNKLVELEHSHPYNKFKSNVCPQCSSEADRNHRDDMKKIHPNAKFYIRHSGGNRREYTKDTKNKPNLLQLHSFNKAVFNTGGEPRELTLLELMKLSQMINSHLKACSEMIHYLQYYKDFESKIEEVLKDSFREDDNEYEIGASFPMFMDDVKNNDQAAEIIQKDFKEDNGENTLIFDPEHSYCYVYTKDKEEARKFLLFTYYRYIKLTLEPWYDGFDEFMKELLAAPKEERNQFIFLGH